MPATQINAGVYLNQRTERGAWSVSNVGALSDHLAHVRNMVDRVVLLAGTPRRLAPAHVGAFLFRLWSSPSGRWVKTPAVAARGTSYRSSVLSNARDAALEPGRCHVPAPLFR